VDYNFVIGKSGGAFVAKSRRRSVISSNNDYASLCSSPSSVCPRPDSHCIRMQSASSGQYSSDLWHAIAIHGKEHRRLRHRSTTNSDGISPSFIRRVMLRNCEFPGKREKKRGREEWRLEKKNPVKFVIFSFQRPITIFDADCCHRYTPCFAKCNRFVL